MSFVDGKEFVIKDVFTNVFDMEENKTYYGEKRNQVHFRVRWEMNIFKSRDSLWFHLKCLKTDSNKFSIETEVKVKLSNKYIKDSSPRYVFEWSPSEKQVGSINFNSVGNHLVDNKLTVEMHVKIIKMSGIINEKLRSFNDESAKKFSDVALIVNDEKFFVGKMFLASHSSYFEALFMGNFEESKQSEITLNDIDPFDFQDFLELIHGVSDVKEDNVEGILKLADMYDSKTTIRRCETFLTEHSKQSLKQKFEMAIKYNMDELKKKCMAGIKTKEDIRSVLPQEDYQMDPTELFNTIYSFM